MIVPLRVEALLGLRPGLLRVPRTNVLSLDELVNDTRMENSLTHVQYTRSVTGRKKGDASRRIVTVRRVVTTRHESSPTVSTVTPEVMSRKGIAEVNFS